MAKGTLNGARRYVSDFADLPSAKSVDYVEVAVPEWGTDDEPVYVLLRRISQGERKRFTSQGELGVLSIMTETERESEITRWRNWYESGKRDMELLRLCYVRPDGSQLFSDAQLRELMERPDSRPWVRLVEAAEQENLITVAAVTDFQKNSPTLRNNGHIALPAPSAS